MNDSTIQSARFERIEFSEYRQKTMQETQIRHWPKNWPTIHQPKRGGEFLSRIWAYYGSPDDVSYEGYSYFFKDTDTELVFSAFSAGSGPAYSGSRQNQNELEIILDVFDALLNKIIPTDCEVQFDTDFGMYRVGAHNGIPFEEPVK